jgi:hypothetical protein
VTYAAERAITNTRAMALLRLVCAVADPDFGDGGQNIFSSFTRKLGTLTRNTLSRHQTIQRLNKQRNNHMLDRFFSPISLLYSVLEFIFHLKKTYLRPMGGGPRPR